MSRCLSVAAIAATVAMVGCNPPDAEKSSRTNLRIFTWWKEGGEEEALTALENEHQKSHPGFKLDRIFAVNSNEAVEELNTRLYAANPPDTFQANGGSNLLSRVVHSKNFDPAVSLLKPLPELAQTVDDNVWWFLKPLVEYGDSLYGVPLNVHRINNLYFSIPKLRKYREIANDQPVTIEALNLPKDLGSFLDVANDLCKRNAGPSIGLGWSDAFTLETLLFENLMPAVAISQQSKWQLLDGEFEGTKFFEEFWKGYRSPANAVNRSVVDGALHLMQELLPCMTPRKEPFGKWTTPFDAMLDHRERPETDWSPVTFVVMGDWATGYLNREYVYGVDYGFVPFPSTESLFIYTTDTLNLTVGASHPTETQEFLATALTADAQLKFSQPKGSIPALAVLTADQKSGLAEYQQDTIDQLEHASETGLQVSPAISGLLTPIIGEKYFCDALLRMVDLDDPVTGRDMVLHTLENNYWLFTKWTETIAQ